MSDLRLSDGFIALTPFHPRDPKAHLAGEDADMERSLSGGTSTPEGLARYMEHCVPAQRDVPGPGVDVAQHLPAR